MADEMSDQVRSQEKEEGKGTNGLSSTRSEWRRGPGVNEGSKRQMRSVDSMHGHALSSRTKSPDPRNTTLSSSSRSSRPSRLLSSINTPWGYTLPSLEGVGLVCNDPIEVDSESKFGIRLGESKR